MKRMKQLELLLGYLEAAKILDELIQNMSDSEASEWLSDIALAYDIPITDENGVIEV